MSRRNAVLSALAAAFAWSCDSPNDAPAPDAAPAAIRPPDDADDAGPSDASGRDADVAGLRLRFAGPGGEGPREVWLDVDGAISRVDCSGGGCDPIAVPGRPAYVGATARAHGFRTQRVGVEIGDWSSERLDLTFDLAPLPAFEETEDYATGFGAGRLEAFRALARPASTELGPVEVVKWYLEDPRGAADVWFQNTRRHPVHYEFVRGVLGRPLAPDEFEARTYRGEDRPAMGGNLVFYPSNTIQTPQGQATGPITIELFPSDDLTPAQALDAYLALEERLGFLADTGGLFYLPAGTTQEAALLADARRFDATGSRYLRRDALYAGLTMQLLNPGISFGTLRELEPEALAATVVSYRDLLLLPRLPNELPLVGGTITGELQTPLAHVNVAAHARGTPNMALLGASEDPRVAPLVGRAVRFEVSADGFSLEPATEAEVDAFWADRLDRPVFVPPHEDGDRGVLPLGELGFGDAVRVGVKAANVAELSRLLPGVAPDGYAVGFGAYAHFMETATLDAERCAGAAADCEEEGRPAVLCAEALARCGAASGVTLQRYAELLLADEPLRGDTALREAAIDGLRWIIRHVPLEDIDPELFVALDDAVEERFGSAKVRLRSSTNAEDLEDFSGAGLYSSTGAWARGDQAASREIRKVWASAWNWRAFEERGFWNIDHANVRVGVLIHEAYVDEAVNGVLVTQNLADPAVPGYYVNAQAGDLPVTNPEGGAIPEVFSVVAGPDGLEIQRARYSSESPEVPLLDDEEVRALFRAAQQAQRHFAPLYDADPRSFALDIEWKLVGPERRLVIKQARPYRL